MNSPWSPEREIHATLARTLIETQFPELAPANSELLGAGWDNTAYLVNGGIVFRFPRRQIAVPLLEVERRLLPGIASHLPLPVPIPQFHGQPDERFPWPFTGYQFLPGRTASAASLDDSQRIRAAEPLARFLRALHGLPVEEMRACGAPPDTLGRLEVARRAARSRERLNKLALLGLVENAEEIAAWLKAAREPKAPPRLALVHGDFYAAHLLVDDAKRPCGVIDWGDVHLGEPALDLALVFGFLPPLGRTSFEATYGAIDDESGRLARFKALEIALALMLYGCEAAKPDLLQEGQMALRYLALH